MWPRQAVFDFFFMGFFFILSRERYDVVSIVARRMRGETLA
jgi:hypothetical protein